MMADENLSGDVLREATSDRLQQELQKINMMSRVSQKIEMFPAKKKEFLYDADKYRDKKQSNKNNALLDKYYCERNSILTDYFKITDIRTICNLFMVISLILFINIIACDIMESKTLSIGIITIQKAFAKFPSSLYIWLCMKILMISVYAVFNVWAYQRLEFLPKSLIRKVWDYGWLTVFIVYNILFIVFSTKAVVDEDLPIACSFFILMELWRMIMKNYAFVRSSAPKFLSYKVHNETAPPSNSGFSHYVYFLFAPTLVYRDNYPRTKRIRWMVVIKHFAQVGIVIFYQAFIVERFIIPVFNVFGTRDLEQKWYIKSTLDAIIPCLFILISGNYLLLHAWMNGWAEILRFADRLFYKDWWNSTNFSVMFPRWNVVVHDWLYTYVYKEMYKIAPRNRSLSIFIVFFLSSIVHDYIVGFACRFYCPTYFIMFLGFGCSYTFAKRYVNSNIFFWICICVCMALMFSTYSMEYYARLNCAPHPNYYVDLFLPRSWNCLRVEDPISD
ncbi:sterol O-acyltransferase 1-like isoform X1 [Linepithema humile]|uniref:sterol O-acyltransferase 1-like isoform X1 n=2 Tax=Linepithema humile TaxID=83485 RepID=UPI00351E6176